MSQPRAEGPATTGKEPLRPLEPGPSVRGFTIGLYLEHLEEASALYDQWRALLDDPELAWYEVDDFEARLEAHLDALVLGGDLALAVCRQQGLEGDFGEAHAALRVFCRHRRLDLLREMLAAMDPDDGDRIRAAADALCQELPPEWSDDIRQMLRGENPAHRRVAARVAGFRQLDLGPDLLACLQETASPGTLSTVAWALGRIRHAPAYPPLSSLYVRHDDPAVRTEAGVALLRIGEARGVRVAAERVRTSAADALIIGLGGDRTHLVSLLELVAGGGASPEVCLGMGLLGDALAVTPLLAVLEDQEVAEEAALALHLITGADLYGEVFVPEEAEEDELFEDERAAGEPTGPPAGSTQVRLSTDPGVWRGWWAENASRFGGGFRYRNGVLATPHALLDNLASGRLPRRLRQLVAEELVVRYGVDVPFETEMSVPLQRHALDRVAGWVATHGARYTPGLWYLRR
jgi:uncharacterized protein (TIGR02270 family)